RTSEINHLLRHLDQFGFEARDIKFDTAKIVARSRQVAAQLSAGVKHLMRKNKITVIEGEATLAGGGKIEVSKGKDRVAAQHIILATGARARGLPGIEPDGKLIWTYKEAMVPEALPKTLLVIGSGAIGIEFASFYRDMGVEVTVVEVLDRVLPAEDEEISAFARKAFEKQGMKIHTSTKVTALKKNGEGVVATFESGGKTSTLSVERVILAVGITGNVENLGLEKTAVRVDKGHIVVDQWLATHEKGIYAIGDVVGPPWLAHKASHEGVICVERIAGLNTVRPLEVSHVPGCTYCRPQVASVGFTERRAREAGYEVRVGRFPYIGNGKAIALGEPEGMVKTVFDAKTGALLGAHMVGAEVTELIQGYAIARTLESTELELMETIFPHPTLSETMHEAVLDAYGRALHF
ncbi:MAG TPA: dihydrolipoyl dehydrogenase, partial [Stellaceae bacterium]|nr:dihydrolipoyl dehydrogenase [Stellaceae bacterium]